MKTIDLYVAPSGNDAWSGRFPDPNAALTDGPLATLSLARDRARALRSSAEAVGTVVRVVLRGGVYELTEPLRLTAEDSGRADAPAIFAAYPGEAPVLSGGRRIRDWQKETVNDRPCWIADLPEVRAGRWTFTQLFVNGERRFRPRLPKNGYYRFADIPPTPAGFAWNNGPTIAGFEPGHIQKWKHLDDVKIVALQLWFEMHHRIRSLDLSARRVEFRCKSIGSLYDEKQLPARYFVENVFEALTEPGEFYLDRTAGRLYYLPLPGEEPATAEVIAPYLTELLVLAGSPSAPIHHVRLENLAFRHAEWDYPADDCGSVQAAWKVPGAVVLEWAEDCVLYGCEVSRLAQYAIEVRTGSAGNRIVACSLFDLGAGGVRIGHENMTRINETTRVIQQGRGDGRRMETTVSDCEIHHGSRIHYQAVSLWVGNSACNRILHNHIHHMNYTGISCGWTWGYADTATIDNRIEFNRIHHINWDRILSDNGGIYTLGRQPGTTLRGNVIHHIGCYGYGGWGIYPDEGSSEMVIENNLVYTTDDAGFSTHYGRDNVVRNNIFALSGRHHINPGKQERHRTTVFERNVVFWRQGAFQTTEWPLGCYLFHDNWLWDGRGGDLDMGGGVPLSAWCALGQHHGTVVADPLFFDPDAGDFTLRADAPVKAMGFKPFDTHLAGPRLKSVRPVACADWPTEKLSAAKPIVHTDIELAEAGPLRVTVTNLGQASAHGRLRLRCVPANALTFTTPPHMDVADLQPGQSRSAEFAVQRRRPLPLITIESVVSGAGLVPTLIFISRDLEWEIPRLKPQKSADAVGAALHRAPKVPILWGRSLPIGIVRLAIAGDQLAVWMRIDDAAVRRGKLPWEGSCVEFFVANAGARPAALSATDPDPLRQLFLLPPAGGQPARICYQDGTDQKEDSRLQINVKALESGYEVTVLLPLDFLRLTTTDKELLCEVAVSFMRSGATVPMRATLFGAPTAYRSSAGYGHVKIRA